MCDQAKTTAIVGLAFETNYGGVLAPGEAYDA